MKNEKKRERKNLSFEADTQPKASENGSISDMEQSQAPLKNNEAAQGQGQVEIPKKKKHSKTKKLKNEDKNEEMNQNGKNSSESSRKNSQKPEGADPRKKGEEETPNGLESQGALGINQNLLLMALGLRPNMPGENRDRNQTEPVLKDILAHSLPTGNIYPDIVYQLVLGNLFSPSSICFPKRQLETLRFWP